MERKRFFGVINYAAHLSAVYIFSCNLREDALPGVRFPLRFFFPVCF